MTHDTKYTKIKLVKVFVNFINNINRRPEISSFVTLRLQIKWTGFSVSIIGYLIFTLGYKPSEVSDFTLVVCYTEE